MATKKSETPTPTRRTFKVHRAFAHEGTYYAGNDVPEIGDLPASVIQDRIERGYITEFRAHVAEGAEPTTPASET